MKEDQRAVQGARQADAGMFCLIILLPHSSARTMVKTAKEDLSKFPFNQC